MQRVTLIDDPLSPGSWERIEVPDVRPFLMERYPTWPKGGRIFEGSVGLDREVTPRSRGDVERLGSYDELVVVLQPESAMLIAVIAITVVLTAAMMFLMPSIPDLSNQQVGSPNNALSDRANKPRPGQRIPDIYGQVRSTPDLIAAPYRVYEDHRELEIAYLCIGRGAYAIEDIRDGDTLVENINGASLSVYGPGTSPNSGHAPQIQIGAPISDPLFNVRRLAEVNGQVMKAPNDEAVRADEEIVFADGGLIQASGGAIDFTEQFQAGDMITVGRAQATGQTQNPVAIFALARGKAPNQLVFPTFDPATEFVAGQRIIIENAVFTTNNAPAGGDITGSVENLDFSYYRVEGFQP